MDDLNGRVPFRVRYDPTYNQTFWSIEGRFFTTRGKPGDIAEGYHPAEDMPDWLRQEFRLGSDEVCNG